MRYCVKQKFYIDESGNTGDLVVSEKNNNFSNQKYFTLACVSLQDSHIKYLEEYIEKLKLKYKIQAPELKFSKINGLLGKKIDFVYELFKQIHKESTFIIELVDKKYLICANIVICLVNPPYFQRDAEQSEILHKVLCQWVYDNITLEFLIKFTNLARNPSEAGLKELFEELLILAKNVSDPLSEYIVESVTETIDIFGEFKEDKSLDREAYTYFLPLPDMSKKGQLIGILPYISSFCNIHARINNLFHRNLSEVEFIHDDQSYFDNIVKYYHDNAADNTIGESQKFGYSDFVFTNISSLKFQNDKATIGLQVADVVAGFINKAIPLLLGRKNDLDENEHTIMIRIIAHLYSQKSINFVLPPKHNDSLFKIFDRILFMNEKSSFFE